jgi:hypothetical protein
MSTGTMTSFIPAPGQGVAFDPHVCLAQIPRGVLWQVGTRPDTIVHSAEDGWVSFRIGGRSKRRWRQVAVVYTAADLYNVEVADLDLRTLDVTVQAQAAGVGCEELGRVVLELVDEVNAR